jgi:hypothetical protein
MKLIALLAVSLSFSTIAAADVALIDNHETVTVDCAADPNVSVSGNHATITLTGTCEKVILSGNHATLTGSAKVVSMPGNENTATLDGVNVISTAGNQNTVTWTKTIDAKLKKPKVKNPGNKNTITRSN